MPRLVTYGQQEPKRDPHKALCDGVYCIRADCSKGEEWRQARGFHLENGKLVHQPDSQHV